MELSLLEIWNSMGLLARAVALALVAMGIASLAVAIERMFVLRRAAGASATFAHDAAPLMEDEEFDSLLDMTKGKAYARAPLPRLVGFGLEVFQTHRRDNVAGAVELTRRELTRRLELLATEARRGMGILASTGSTAPFIGLFGTVIGIITAFQGIAAAGGGGIGAVSSGIAEALIVTAVGLFVAIWAVLTFNYLTARFERFDMTMQHAAGELLDYLEASSDGSRARNR